MSAEIISLEPAIVGDGVTLSPQTILDAASGKYDTIVLVGERPDGEIEVCGTAGAGDTLIMLQWAASFIVANRCGRS